MKKFASVAFGAAALAAAFTATPVSAGTFYKSPPANGYLTGSLNFSGPLGPFTCSVTSSWNLSGGNVSFAGAVLSGDFRCATINFAGSGQVMLPASSTHGAILLVWTSPGPISCADTSTGPFDNTTSTLTIYGPPSGCKVSGTLSFLAAPPGVPGALPSLQLLP